jgi:gliding motility-associated-like protein
LKSDPEYDVSDPEQPAGDRWMWHMRAGDFVRAWEISDAVLRSRSGAPGSQLPRHEQTIWDGTPVDGRVVLVRCYHGLGDTIQFARYLPRLRQRAAHVILWAQPPLIPLLQTVDPEVEILPLHDGDPGVAYDVDLEIMELGHAFRSTLATLPAPGTYAITVQETSSSGCVGPLYTTPFVVSPLPVAPTITGSGFVCNTATAQSFAIANPPVGATYQWTITGGTVTSGGNSSQVTVRFNPTGPYAVSAAEISASPALCQGPVATRTILLDNPSISLNLVSVDITSNNKIVLTLNAPNSANTPNPVRVLRRVAGQGAFVAVGTVAASATTYTDNNAVDASANTYEYQLELTNGCGTVLSSAVAQTVRLVATAKPGPGGRDQGSVTLSWNAYVGAPVTEYIIVRRLDANAGVEVTRVPGTTLQATISNTDASATATGFGFEQNFRVIAFINGIPFNFNSNSNEAQVRFEGLTKTYNIITPNRDGQNDVLVIDNIQLYPGNTFTVFNRWGREVYKTTNYQNNWGGDENTAPGTYFYLMQMPNGTSFKNWFEVVK